MRPTAAMFCFACLISGCSESTRDEQVLVFSGVCDGSAAIRVSREQLLVAYDEHNKLYLYDAQGGRFTHSYPLTDLLQLPDDAELDLEAAAIHDGGIWWIGSHGLNSDAGLAPNRNVIFQTTIPGGAGEPFQLLGKYNLTSLLSAIVGDDVQDLAPKKGGLNIEGMSTTVGNDLLIALRSPLSNTKKGDAYIVRISRHENGFRHRRTYLLDLGNRGVRDLVSTEGGYLLIAGDVAGGGEFSVYKWQLPTEPVDMKESVSSGVLEELFSVPEDFNAEALVDMGHHWLLLSDDGKTVRPDKTAADGERTCDKILSRSSPHSHESVYFRGLIFTVN